MAEIGPVVPGEKGHGKNETQIKPKAMVSKAAVRLSPLYRRHGVAVAKRWENGRRIGRALNYATPAKEDEVGEE